jgi:pyruvate/2-oxoacid:ferredoxin oxidoreductase alpha subunit
LSQRSDDIDALMRRLFRKITQGFHEIQRVETFMMEDAEIAVISYGSVARSSRRAVISRVPPGTEVINLKALRAGVKAAENYYMKKTAADGGGRGRIAATRQ